MPAPVVSPIPLATRRLFPADALALLALRLREMPEYEPHRARLAYYEALEAFAPAMDHLSWSTFAHSLQRAVAGPAVVAWEFIWQLQHSGIDYEYQWACSTDGIRLAVGLAVAGGNFD